MSAASSGVHLVCHGARDDAALGAPISHFGTRFLPGTMVQRLIISLRVPSRQARSSLFAFIGLFRNERFPETLTTITGNGFDQAPVTERPVVLPPERLREQNMTPFQPTDQPTIMRNERLRMRREFAEVIAGARHTIAQSRALIDEADAILAGEKNCRITPHLMSQSNGAFGVFDA